MKKTSVMIIDDHELIRDAWTAILQSENKYQIIDKIGDSAKVEDRITKLHPDVILLDINMSPLDGFEVLKIIRSKSPSSKVIGVSMHSQTSYVKKMLKEGANGYVTKNSSAQELLQAIDAVMKGERYICKEIKNAFADQVLQNEISPIAKLTPREIQIIRLLMKGLSSKQIADTIFLTPKTVEVHRHNILKKLKVNNSLAAVEIAKAHGL